MKRSLIALSLLAFFSLISAISITEWNFDSSTTTPNTGTGTLTLNGGVTSDGFNTGYGTSGMGWSTTTYPAQGTNNQTAGMYIEVSTAGYTSISMSWAIRHSNTSANREVLFYTLDKTASTPVWTSAGTYNATVGDAWLLSSYDGSTISGLANNANLAFKIVSSFANTGNTQYMPSNSTSTYSGGKWRFDNIIVSGIALTPNLIITANLTTFYATVGNSSTMQSYTVDGVNLTSSLTITAPTYFYVRVNGTVSYTSSVVIEPRSGAINKTIEVIYQPLIAGVHTGNIVHSGGGLSVSQDLAVDGSTTVPEPSSYPTNLHSSGISYYQAYLNWNDSTGMILPAGYLIKGSKVSADSIAAPVDGVVEEDKKLTKNVAYGVQTRLIYELNENHTYYFKIYPYTNSGTAINYKTDGTIPLLEITTTTGPIGSTLEPGDIAFIEYASDSPDRFTFVLLTEIMENTLINFTDKAWTGNAFAEGEEMYFWRAVGRPYHPGEVIHIVEGVLYDDEGIYNPDFAGFSNSGDQIIAYQNYVTDPLIIAAFSTTGWISSGIPTNNSSYLPSVLTLGVNALGFSTEIDDGVYNGITSGSPEELRLAMNNPVNWIRNNSLGGIIYPDWSITVLNTLSIPDASIAHLGTGIFRISWAEVSGATWYSVYSSYDPVAEFPTGWTPLNLYVEDTHLDCYYSVDPAKQFYLVIAHN